MPADWSLELALPPEEAPALRRKLRQGRTDEKRGSNGARLTILWHDTAEGTLAADGLVLAERRQGRETLWRLERLRPADDAIAPAGTPVSVLAEAAAPDGLGMPLPQGLQPVAGFDGRVRTLPAPPGMTAQLLEGTLRAAAGAHAACRLILSGDARAVAALALELTEELRLAVPPRALAADALVVAGRGAAPRRLGAPQLPQGLAADGAFAFACGHLADVTQHYAALAAQARPGADPEPVHQIRVASRRLGSAIRLFRGTLGCPELEAAEAGLRALRTTLGPARDWDVFLAGTGAALAQAFPGDATATRLLAAARRHRAAGYAALRVWLDSAAFRRLGILLTLLATAAPWPEPGEAPDSLGQFAAHKLDRSWRRVMEAGENLEELEAEALHQLRLAAKRLRYTAELFAPLYSRRESARLLRRLSGLQDRLGLLNDGTTAARLMEALGPAGGRSFAAGLVRGLVAAEAMEARAKLHSSWRRLRRMEPFWEDG